MDPGTTTNVLLAVIALIGAFATALLTFVLNSVSRIETRLGALETRFGNLETRFGALETRFGALETRVSTVEATLTARIDSVEATMSARIDSVEATLSARMDAIGDRIIHEVRLMVHDLDERLRVLEDRPSPNR